MKRKFMKIVLPFIVSVLTVVALGGCREHSPFELVDEESTNQIEVALIVSEEVVIEDGASIDSTALLKRDEEEYPATFSITAVTTENGSQRSSYSFVRALLNDRRRPVEYMGRPIGFIGMDVGSMAINGLALSKVTRRFSVPGGPPLTIDMGVYYRSLNIPVMANTDFTFQTAGTDSVDPFAVAIKVPDIINMARPGPQAVVLTSEDLLVERQGDPASFLHMVISGFDGASGQVDRPLLLVKVANPGQSFKIPSKVLKLLPEGTYDRFMFSLISFNRVSTIIPGYPDKVLVQAATIHNLVLPVRSR
jgi:hypothetical protein